MATGFAPKEPDQRRNRHEPKRGEWVDIPRIGTTDVPPCPRDNPETVRAWAAWWADPASSQWTQSDVDAVHDLARLHSEFSDGKLSYAGEIRLRSDGLGLTQKGKRDLRWKVATDDAPARVEKSGRRKLKLA